MHAHASSFNKELEANPKYGRDSYYMALAYQSLGRKIEAAQQFDTLVRGPQRCQGRVSVGSTLKEHSLCLGYQDCMVCLQPGSYDLFMSGRPIDFDTIDLLRVA